jgi:hypothetical protein
MVPTGNATVHQRQVRMSHPDATIAPGPLARTVRTSMGGPATTSMTTDWLTVPPGPSHISEYVAVASSGPRTSVPLVAFCPRHVLPSAPTFDAVQRVTLAEDHVSVDISPG